MLNIFRNFRQFISTFGICNRWQATILIGGGVVTSMLELLGLSILFPLLSVIFQPDYIHTNPFMQRVSSLTGITSPAYMTMLVGLFIAGVFILKNVVQIAYLNYENRTLTAWRIHITSRLYHAYMNTDYELFMRHSSSRMINMITQTIPFILHSYVHMSLTLLNYLLTGAVILAFIMYVNWLVALTLLAFGVVMGLVYTRIFRRATRRLGNVTQILGNQQQALLQQAFAGYKETQSHLKENVFSRKFLSNAEQLARTNGRLFFIENLPLSMVEMVVMVLLIAIFEVIILSGANTSLAITQVGLIVFASLRMIPVINRTLVSMVMTNSSVQPLQNLLAEVQSFRINPDIFHAKHPPSSSTNEDVTPLPFNQALVLSDVSYMYPDTEQAALTNLNLTVQPGEFIGITGPSGSGKSTLVNLVLGFLTSFRGAFTVDGTAITPENIRGLRKIVGLVDQNIFVMDTTIAENVAYGIAPDAIDRDLVKQSLIKAQLWEMTEKLPEGIDSPVGENGKLLSGGQRQRLVIARAFYRDLKILILDEASASLDVETEHKFFTFLKTLKGELTVIMIAHRLSTLKECDRIYFMQNGTFTAQGDFAHMHRTSDTFRHYVTQSNLQVPD